MQHSAGEHDSTQPSALEIASRLAALRTAQPALRIGTELIRLDDSVAVVRVELVLPDGGFVSALGSAPATTADAVEHAENRALGRALVNLGYGTAGTETPRPVAVSEPVVVAPPKPVLEPAPSPTGVVDPPKSPVLPPPEEFEAENEPPESPEPDVEDDPPLEDYSWTSFWQWARKIGYQNKVEVEKVIGESITSLNPAQVRNLLRTKTGAGER